jgi:hypothetical protein
MLIRILTFATISLLSATALAVDTKNCPQTFKLSYEKLSTLTDDKLDGPDYGDDYEHNTKEVRDLVAKTPGEDFQNLQMRLVEIKSGQCRYIYLNEKEENVGDDETRLMTRDGRDILRVSLKVADTYVWTYHNVTDYSPDNIELEEKEYTAVYGFFDHGAPRHVVGFAKNALVTTIDMAALEKIASAAILDKYKKEFDVDYELEIFDYQVDEVTASKVELGVGVGYVRDPEGGIPDWCNITLRKKGNKWSVTELECSPYD